jgi:DHA2 family metal-tetracycline-proton antiporter-like MFS transporter
MDRSNGNRLLIVLFFTLILSVMNATMFNVALPEIRSEFHLTSATVGWVLSGYIVMYAIGSVTYGKLADGIPLKTLLTFGLIIVALGSAFGLFAQAFWMVMVGRILQSVGASVIPAVAMLIPVRYFEPAQRGRALGMVSTGLATGTAIGPIVAGTIASVFDWRWLFLLPVLMLGTLPFYYKYLQAEELKATRMDWFGGAWLAGTIVCLLLAITKSSWLLAGAGAAFAALLVMRTARAETPFLARSLFANGKYVRALVLAFLTTGLIFVLPFTMPLLLHDLHGLQVGQIGLVMAPGAVVAALLGRRVGRMVDERGNVVVFMLAAGSMVVAFTALAVGVAWHVVLLAVLLVVTSVGQVGIQVSMSNTVAGTLPREMAGLGMGMFSMMNFISGAMATTLIGKLVALHDVAWMYRAIFIALAALLAVLVGVRRRV